MVFERFMKGNINGGDSPNINDIDGPQIHVTCPHCGKEFTKTINFFGRTASAG